MTNESEVTSAIEIISIVRQLIEKRELLNASFNLGRDDMTTLLLDADPQRGILIIDASRDESINRKIVASNKVTFSGTLRGTKIRFASAAAKEIKYRGAPALSMRFPGLLIRTQNRGAFRVRTHGTFCALPVPGRGLLKVPVTDLSIGGVQLELSSAAENFMLRQTLSGCQIDLGSLGKVNCNLDVRTLKLMPNRKTGMGCLFVGLSKANEALIARFVAQQELRGVSR